MAATRSPAAPRTRPADGGGRRAQSVSAHRIRHVPALDGLRGAAPGSTVSWILDTGPADMNNRVACMNDIYRNIAAAEPNVELVDFAPNVCASKDVCNNAIDGVNLREDTIHFEKDSARLVARWIVPRVLAAARKEG